MNIALTAHDRMKDGMVDLVREFAPALRSHRIVATGTTGRRLHDGVGLEVECLLSGPLGGDLQVGARLATGLVDMVIFLRDPMTPNRTNPTSMPLCEPATCTTRLVQPTAPLRGSYCTV